jgi:hypothetical protein
MDQRKRPEPATEEKLEREKPAKPAREAPLGKGASIVSRRDQGGTKYPGDWPNPLDGFTRGCF